jgi:hypothetical protein
MTGARVSPWFARRIVASAGSLLAFGALLHSGSRRDLFDLIVPLCALLVAAFVIHRGACS